MTDFTMLYADMIAKDIYKKINQLINKREKINARIVEMGKCDKTQRYWSAIAATEQSTNEIESLLERLIDLDNQTNFSSKLHQDRFKFIEKYSEVHEMLLGRRTK